MINVTPGVYELAVNLDNPRADRRKKHGLRWYDRDVFEMGTRFVVHSAPNSDGARIRKVGTPSHHAINVLDERIIGGLAYMRAVDEDDLGVDERADMLGVREVLPDSPTPVLQFMVDRGFVTMETIVSVLRAYDEQVEQQIEAETEQLEMFPGQPGAS